MIKPGMFISDRYEIVDRVGSGGMADVYKAKCHRLNRYVAIKILKPEYSSDKNFVTKFRGEAQSVAGLSHPNIVNVYDVGDDDGLYYIVMELVEGITLKKFIERKGKLEVKEAVGIAIQIAQGMEAAHDNHIIHRDIKPQNIIISRDGKVKVTDFGIAKAASTNTVTQNAIGSVHYLSPEQARGGYSDERSDIYSLGVTMYEMLSGEVPFAGDNTVSVALLHIQGEATPLRELNPDVPVSLERIVQKCMQKKPERRYISASELISDLKRSIINKDGDYVVINNGVVSDSPTITLSDDEMNHIKSAAKTPVTFIDNNAKDKGTKKVSKEEEEELDSVDSKMEKVLIISMIAAAVLVGCTVLFIVARFFNIFDWGKGNKDTDITPVPSITVTVSPEPTEEPVADLVKVPEVRGLDRDTAISSLTLASRLFNVTLADEKEYSDEYEEGLVMNQNYPAGTEIPSNSTIILTISAGAQPVELIDVYNRSYEQARKQLEDLGFKVERKDEANSDIGAEFVIRTTPERATDPKNPVMLKKGSTVTLVVSTGPDVSALKKVPNLLGKTEEQAKQALLEAGLQKGVTSNIPSSEYAKGAVCYQNTTAGELVTADTKIDISISTGVESTPTPDVSLPDEYGYFGKVTITENPFEEGESGDVYLELEQDGESMLIMQKYLSYDDFPKALKNIKVEGIREGDGIVRMYIDDVPYGSSWSVFLSAEKKK
ncbi:Stk1 family PASTA domain-containing Ser/Thr kinase [Lachnoclostridium phytofermentans]|uniref:non-specific serine/threonine protein kinase n=1 Tax=Lachnoclostridium phytofermentans (strain ATCC 700394 / DSM 18823 / ISDg) TaxID=357809 RepID=A9KM93_LACP7|nr:Stk1 family PASTA domain-containing Ser/Thr kinase [Lachnoclostridium phytofermentans]ABX42847.1 serine/threonine protein kinase with PASTA sensor(s) [Lachnoclostridium phytofermentans ISDg]